MWKIILKVPNSKMKKLFLLPLLLFSIAAHAQSYMLLPIVDVYDGDTIKTDLGKRMPPPLNKISIRLYGIDTPEKGWRAKCPKEALLAEQAKDYVVQLTANHSKMKVTNYKYGKFGGRIVGTVIVGGVDISKALIEKGYAVPYFGGKKTKDWCN